MRDPSTRGQAAASNRAHALWIAKALARTELSPLAPEDVAALERSCTARSLEPGTLVASAGQMATSVWLVRRGELLLEHPGRDGRVVVGRVRPGDVVGDIPLLCDGPFPTDVRAGVQTDVIVIERGDLLELLRSSPSFGMRWTTSVAKRLEHSQRRLVSLLTGDLSAQLAALLLDEREETRGSAVVALPHSVMAQLLGVRRPSISRTLARMRRQGLVGGGYRQVRLLDLDGLARMAGQGPDEG